MLTAVLYVHQRAVWLALCTFSSLQVFYVSTQGVLVVEAFLMLESLDFIHVLAAVFLLGMMVGALATMLMIKCGLCGFGQKRSALPGPWHVQKIQKILPEEIYICRSSRCFHVSQTCQKNVQTFPICQHCLKHEMKKTADLEKKLHQSTAESYKMRACTSGYEC